MPGGRPTEYKDEYPEAARSACEAGATDASLAMLFGVAESTINEWKKRFPEFSESIKAGKCTADDEIVKSLHDKAKGAEWLEEQAIKVKRVEYANGKRVLEQESVEVVEVTRRAAPDTPAAIFWLKNRRKEDWRDKQEVEHQGLTLTLPSDPRKL